MSTECCTFNPLNLRMLIPQHCYLFDFVLFLCFRSIARNPLKSELKMTSWHHSILGINAAIPGIGPTTLERIKPRIDHTPELECTSLGSSALGRAQCVRRLLTAQTWFSISQLDQEIDLQFYLGFQGFQGFLVPINISYNL